MSLLGQVMNRDDALEVAMTDDRRTAGNRSIVLVTWCYACNFGTNLQAWALQQALRKLGCRVSVLFRRPSSSPGKYLRYCLFSHGLLRRHASFKRGGVSRLEAWMARRMHFVDTQIPRGLLVRRTDCFVTGSDQIWNTYHGFDPTMFLDFAGEKKRVAYASSIGTKDVNPVYADVVSKLLARYSHIGVRERSAVEALQKLTGRADIVQVPDPTFLVEVADWREITRDVKLPFELPQRYVLCYLLGNNRRYADQLRSVCEKIGIYDVVIVPACENPNFDFPGAIRLREADADEFVYLIDHASFVCTDSFHCSAISLNLEKDFVEFRRFSDEDSQSQNSRVYELLEHFGVSNRLYERGTGDWTKPVSYDSVRRQLAVDRRRAMDYLTKAIET